MASERACELCGVALNERNWKRRKGGAIVCQSCAAEMDAFRLDCCGLPIGDAGK